MALRKKKEGKSVQRSLGSGVGRQSDGVIEMGGRLEKACFSFLFWC